jgi:mannosyltransferase OCH1-like enzyme
MIPKIIWQTYESEYKDLPPLALECANSWQEKNPDWEYRYISGKERADFILSNFGEEWFDIYNSYKANISKADLWRYMCLYVNGGLYADLDILCKEPIGHFFDLSHDFITSEEPGGPGYSQMIFASSPQNIFLENILNNIKTKYYEKNSYSNIIDYVTKEVGYIIFTDSIIQTVTSKEINKNTFILYKNEEAKKIHNKAINHYRAGRKEKIFGPNYVAWQTEEYK